MCLEIERSKASIIKREFTYCVRPVPPPSEALLVVSRIPLPQLTCLLASLMTFLLPLPKKKGVFLNISGTLGFKVYKDIGTYCFYYIFIFM